MKELPFKIEANAEGKWILRDGETTKPATRYEFVLWYEREQLVSHIEILHKPFFKEFYTAFIEEFVKAHMGKMLREKLAEDQDKGSAPLPETT
jgi:hypothetical protein